MARNTALKAWVSFNLGCAATSSGGRKYPEENGGNPIEFPESVTAGVNNNIPQCPLRSDVPLPGAARIPCRAFPAHSPCHSQLALTPAVPGLMAHTAALQFKSRSPQLRAVPGVPVSPVSPRQRSQPSSEPRHSPGQRPS